MSKHVHLSTDKARNDDKNRGSRCSHFTASETKIMKLFKVYLPQAVMSKNLLYALTFSHTSLNDGDVLRNASLGNFVVVRKCTYTNLDSVV